MNNYKTFIQILSAMFLVFIASNLQGQVVTHNIGSTSLTIPGESTNDYIITQSNNTTATTNTIRVGAGYRGTITLKGVNMTSAGNSCILVLGEYNRSNRNPYTKVDIVLDGNNELTYTKVISGCAFQVDQGAQIHINAIDRNDNTSGTLAATNTQEGAAAIGAPYSATQGTSVISGCAGGQSSNRTNTAGGNVIIGSGTVTAKATAHGAGIGGGWYSYYNGIIIVYGGIVTATSGKHAAGIGSGCPQGSGVISCHADNSTIVALPPATISASGSGLPALGLAGAKNITYINDPGKPLITVRTEDSEPNANIYLDLTQTPGLVNIFNDLSIAYDLTKVRVGRTDALGLLKFNAEFPQSTTFYTDASSSKPATLGRPYMPVTRTVTTAATIVLPLLTTNISFTDYPSTPLEVGYTSTQAHANAHRIKVAYNDATSMTNVTFQLQDGASSDFAGLQFYGADGTTSISTPATFTSGMVFYIVIPIKQGKPIGVYSDVLLIDGKYGSTALPGYIRRIGQQRVVDDDSQTNTHIKVTASPNRFTSVLPTTNTVTLTLKIDHTGTPVLYNPLDVVAKYLVTTIADYDAALAASPLSSSDWTPLNVPATNNTNTNTTVPFAGKPEGTYYIHWYVESGVVYAHSLTVTDPPRTYGGFGPYILKQAKVTLSLDKTSIDEGGAAATGTATLTATLNGADTAPTGGITVTLTYGGTATHATDYTAPASIAILAGANSATIGIVALADYLIEDSGYGNETITITAPALVNVDGIPYEILGSPLNIGIVDKTDGSISAHWVRDAAEPGTKGQVMFKLPGSGSTAVSCTRPVKVAYSYSGAPAAGSYMPNSLAEAIIPAGQNSVTVDVLTPIDNYLVEGSRQVIITITGVTAQ